MYNIFQYLNYFNKKHFRNILIYNCEDLSNEDILEISNRVDDLYVVISNNFLRSSLAIKLRFNRKIHFLSSVYIPHIDYEVIFTHDIENLSNFLINNERIAFLVYLNINQIKIPGYSHVGNNVYKRDLNKVLVDVNEANNDFEKTKENFKNLDKVILNTSWEKKPEVKRNHNYFEINIKSLKPLSVKYNKNSIEKNYDGILALTSIINSKNDVTNFKEKLKIIQQQYSNIKTYVIINGKYNFRYLNEFINSNNIIKLESKINEDQIKNMFNMLIDNEYILNLNEIDKNALTDIWKNLK